MTVTDLEPAVVQPAPIAACYASGMDPDLWSEATHLSTLRNRAAVAYCYACPLVASCFAAAEAQRTAPETSVVTSWRPRGIWGGRLYDGTRKRPTAVPTAPR